MKHRVQKALTNSNITTRVAIDLVHTLTSSGVFGNESAAELIESIFGHLVMSTGGLLRTEEMIRHKIAILRPQFAANLAVGLSDRASLVADQLQQLVQPNARIADIGCGDGKVAAEIIKRHNPSYYLGFDVLNYLAPGVNINFRQYDGRNIPLFAGERASFDQVLLTNVLHHADLDGWLIANAYMLLKPGGQVLVHETVPDPKAENDPVEVERVFLLDYVYNRLFHDADIPVPGAYETANNWPGRFAFNARFELVRAIDLGVDQRLIRDHHVLYVFEALPEEAKVFSFDPRSVVWENLGAA